MTNRRSSMRCVWRPKVRGTLAIISSLVFALAVAVLSFVPHQSRAASSEVVVPASADSYVRSDVPTHVYGSASSIYADRSPLTRGYLRFDVSTLGGGQASKARLRLYVSDSSQNAGLRVFAVSNDWQEQSLTWKNKPPLDRLVAERAPTALEQGNWVEIELGPAITGNGSYSFALTTDATDRIGFRSRTRSQAPQLVLTTDAAASSASPSTATPAPATATPPAPATAVPASGGYPPNTTLSPASLARSARPAYLQPVRDPAFGTTITRIADQSAFGVSNTNVRHNYSKTSAWNSDGSLIMLVYTDLNPSPILDGQTYQLLRKIYVPSWAVWANTDPNATYGTRSGNQFVRCNMTTGAVTVLHQFSEYDSISIGEGEGNLSNDDHYVALMARKGGTTALLVYDIPNNSVVSTLSLGGQWPNNASMSQSGDYVVVDWAGVAEGARRNAGLEVFDRSLKFLRQLETYTEHGDLAYDSDGNEAYVMWSRQTSGIVALRLNGNGRINVSSGTWIAGHISCRNIRRPGWCYTSDDSGTTTRAGSNEVYAIKLDGSATVERFAYEHHSQGLGYEAQPQAVPNPTGTKVMWASDWHSGGGGPIYSYVAEWKGGGQ